MAKHAPRAERAAVRAYLRKAEEHQKSGDVSVSHERKDPRELELQLEPEEEAQSVALSFDEPVVSPKVLFDRHELAQQRELYPDAVSLVSFNVLANKYVANPRKKDLYRYG